jgi:hypothetical protein
MARSNWSGEDPNGNASRNSERVARQGQAKQQDRAARAAGHGKRRI